MDDIVENEDVAPIKSCRVLAPLRLVNASPNDIDDQLQRDPPNKHYFPLNQLASECLTNIMTRVMSCQSIRYLRCAGNKMLNAKLAQSITSLYLMRNVRKVLIEQRSMHHLLTMSFHHLRILHFRGWGGYCGSFPWSALPMALTELVLKSHHLHPPSVTLRCDEHQHLEGTTHIRLPNLIRLRLDMCRLYNYPICLDYSPLLTRLSLSPSRSEPSGHCEQLLLQVPQLTRLSLIHKDMSIRTDAFSIDSLTSLTQLSIVRCHITHITPTIVMFKTTQYNEDSLTAMIRSSRGSLTNLTSFRSYAMTDLHWPKLLLEVGAPALHTLHIDEPGKDVAHTNFWLAFPHLRRLNMAACHCPLFWSSIPVDGVVTSFGKEFWKCKSWSSQIEALIAHNRLKDAFTKMPRFYSIEIDQMWIDTDRWCNAICAAIPVAVLNQVQRLTMQTSSSASRLIRHATSATHIQADFYSHLINFANCHMLSSLELNRSKMPLSIGSLEPSLATVPTTLTVLKCMPQLPASDWMPCLSIESIARFTRLTNLHCSFALPSCVETMPDSIQHLRFAVSDIGQRTLSNMQLLQTSKPELQSIDLTGKPVDDETVELLKSWIPSVASLDLDSKPRMVTTYRWYRQQKKRPSTTVLERPSSSENKPPQPM